MLGGRLRQRAQRDFIKAELGARELTIIGGRIVGRLAIERPRVLLATQRFGGAALPIERARQRNRVGHALGDPGEMRQRGGRLMEKPQARSSRR